jgi:peroxiredoxin
MLKAGETAPDFRLGDTNLDVLLANGPVLLAFFKISCPVCQFTFPFLERMADKAPVLGISQDDAESTDEFRRAFKLTFPLAIDDPGYPVSNAYKLTHVPSLFLVEPDRRISTAVSGFSKRDLQEIGQRFRASPFREGERVPEFRPG